MSTTITQWVAKTRQVVVHECFAPWDFADRANGAGIVFSDVSSERGNEWIVSRCDNPELFKPSYHHSPFTLQVKSAFEQWIPCYEVYFYYDLS